MTFYNIMNQNLHENLIKSATQTAFSHPSKFLKFKKQFCSRAKIPQPTNANLRQLYEKMVREKKIKRNFNLEKAMLAHSARTQSGVAIIAVLTKPYACPGQCVFCPTEKNIPKSYLPNEPAVMRAVMNKFNPYHQVQSRIKALELNGHNTDKIELIVMGGTFSYFPKHYQKWFIAECFRACNEYKKSKNTNAKTTLEKEQKRNENSKHRIVGLTLETRPDYIDEKEILNFRKLGCTRVELGVQTIFDDILKLNKRGHKVSATIRATRLLKDAGFKINYHLMPGLYGSNRQKDYEMFARLFSDSNFQPDMLKIYPTLVIKNSQLYRLWKKGAYQPLTDRDFENLIIKVKNEIIPPYIRIQRLVRDVPLPSIEAGPKISNLRQIIAAKTHCQCIRCREVKETYKSDNKIILDRIDYNGSGGKEIFLQFIDSPSASKKETDNKRNKLYALLRLRIPSSLISSSSQKKEQKNTLYEKIPVLKNAALIREVHTFGKLIPIGKKEKKSPQHIGLGKKLIQEAEKIAREEFGISKIAVISGVGVRNYYRKLGYRLKDNYMVKKIR